MVDGDNREREDDEDHLFASIEELADFTKACSRRVGSCERDVASVRALHRAHAKRVDDSHDALREENAGWRDVTGERLADDFKQAVKSSLDNLVHFGHESWTALVEESATPKGTTLRRQSAEVLFGTRYDDEDILIADITDVDEVRATDSRPPASLARVRAPGCCRGGCSVTRRQR